MDLYDDARSTNICLVTTDDVFDVYLEKSWTSTISGPHFDYCNPI